MLSRRSLLLSIALITAGYLFFNISYFNSGVKIPFVKSQPLSLLTGLPAVSGPVLVVKIDDTTNAHPQVGLKSADVIYIEQVEGGLTRLAAFFSSTIPGQIGPVRSARISDLELLSQYGKVGFAYSGAQRKLYPEIAAANLYDLGANKYGAEFYKNDPARNAPYAMMLNAPALLTAATERGAIPDVAKAMGWKFGSGSDLAVKIDGAEFTWPAARYGAQWSKAEERWLLSHNGSPNLDSQGYHLGPKTIVIQIASITDSIYKDKVGGVTPFTATVGSGSCYLLRDGSYLPCRWNRSDAASGTTFTDLAGGEINFAPGQIWFALTSKEPVFTAPFLEDATKSKSK